jgi:hypothetical protein
MWFFVRRQLRSLSLVSPQILPEDIINHVTGPIEALTVT